MSGIARWCFRHRYLVLGLWVAALVLLVAANKTLGKDYTQGFSAPGTDSSHAQALLDHVPKGPGSGDDTIVIHTSGTTAGHRPRGPAQGRPRAHDDRRPAADRQRPQSLPGNDGVAGERRPAHGVRRCELHQERPGPDQGRHHPTCRGGLGPARPGTPGRVRRRRLPDPQGQPALGQRRDRAGRGGHRAAAGLRLAPGHRDPAPRRDLRGRCRHPAGRAAQSSPVDQRVHPERRRPDRHRGRRRLRPVRRHPPPQRSALRSDPREGNGDRDGDLRASRGLRRRDRRGRDARPAAPAGGLPDRRRARCRNHRRPRRGSRNDIASGPVRGARPARAQPSATSPTGYRPAACLPTRVGAGIGGRRSSNAGRRHSGSRALAIIAILAVPSLSIHLGSSDQGNDPASSTTRQAYDLLAQGFGAGYNGPLLVVASTPDAAARTAFARLEVRAAGHPRVSRAPTVVPSTAGSDVSVLDVVPTTSPQSDQTQQLLTDCGHAHPPRRARHQPARLRRGSDRRLRRLRQRPVGQASALPDRRVTFGFLLLLFAFRSIVIPLTAAVMNVLAAGAAFGVVVAIFQWGWGSEAIGLGQAGPIESFLPVMLIAILFGLSMDYQVFLVSRIQEEWLRVRRHRSRPSAPGKPPPAASSPPPRRSWSSSSWPSSSKADARSASSGWGWPPRSCSTRSC